MAQRKLSGRRHQHILESLANDGIVKIDEISTSTGVSPITIRRDLDFLQQQGLLERIHGGALPLKNQQLELPYTKREHLQEKEKTAIGRETADLIPDRAIIFVSSGSTTLEVLRHLVHRNIQVITNNVDSVYLLNGGNAMPALELIIVGGQYRYQSHSLSGDLALNTITNIYSSYTILGVNGIHPQYGVTNSWYQHVSLHKKMIENCKGKIIVVADSSKITVVSNFVCAQIQQVDILVTDSGIKKEDSQCFADMGIRVVVASI